MVRLFNFVDKSVFGLIFSTTQNIWQVEMSCLAAFNIGVTVCMHHIYMACLTSMWTL